MNEQELLKALKKAYPDHVIRNLSELGFYSDLREIALSKGMRPREYVLSLGFIRHTEWRDSQAG